MSAARREVRGNERPFSAVGKVRFQRGSAAGKISVQGRNRHAKLLRYFLHSDRWISQHRLRAFHLGRTERWLATTTPASRARNRQARVSPLQRELPLELGDRCEHMKHQPSAGRAGVDLLREHLEPNLARLKVGGRLDELAH
jgi:hypothetical protein